MPIEIMARRGADTIRFGPMKPVGLRDPRTGKRPWAVLQLRRENAAGSLYNLVGFQTNLKFGEQKRVFSMIPATSILQVVSITPMGLGRSRPRASEKTERTLASRSALMGLGNLTLCR